ncbi:MAG: CPBP family intramembrane metalloprotease [Clostridia bacterium]|nr:CPBP family intramembrane metalloprotease [Clostridia bacterium]MBQ9860902.1 CPBP family intramembrane metalloprotease [Clostridia bacterium]
MKKLYEKNAVTFALVWIGLYVIVMNIALQFCGGLDDLATKTVPQMLVPVICITILAVASTAWIVRNGLTKEFGLCGFGGSARSFLWFLPLIIMSGINLKNGLFIPASLPVAFLMAINLAVGGYVEEIIFRGFLFRGMAKNHLGSAIVVSAVTFGAGHIVNLFNTADHIGVFLQISYAIVIGFLYTVIVYKGGSLYPCIASHMFVNGSSVFAPGQGPFSNLVASVFGQATPLLVQGCSAGLIIIISGSYAWWLWKKA